ncbi:uncharacterized protein LOC141858259 [Brevipalpus obovatus]|uniref:uncharacterized protein LOC141858259 n=1 Tax=Brevipalpus obovatus TaxID=246614 RepID=UPI003D9F2DD9
MIFPAQISKKSSLFQLIVSNFFLTALCTIELNQSNMKDLCLKARQMSTSGLSENEISDNLNRDLGGSFKRSGNSHDSEALTTESLMLKSLVGALTQRQFTGSIPPSVVYVKNKYKTKDSVTSKAVIAAQDNASVNSGSVATFLLTQQAGNKYKNTVAKQKFVNFQVTVVPVTRNQPIARKMAKRESVISQGRFLEGCPCDSLPPVTIEGSKLNEFLQYIQSLRATCRSGN